MKNKIRAPSNLSREAQKWWRRLVNVYQITDSGGLLILQALCEAFDRMRAAQEVLQKEGLVLEDRFLQKKAHPLCAVEKDYRNQNRQAPAG